MIVVDVETTGIIPGKHGIVSIGAIEFKKPTNQFYGECRIDQDTEIDPMALQINGFTEEQIKDLAKPSLAELILTFDTWLVNHKDRTIAGHNTGFDLNMLWAAYRKHGIKSRFGYRHVDLHSLVYTHLLKRGLPIPKFKDRSAINFDFISQYTGLPAEPKPHNGLTGAKMEAEALSRMIHGKNLLPEFKKYSIPDYLK